MGQTQHANWPTDLPTLVTTTISPLNAKVRENRQRLRTVADWAESLDPRR